MSTTNVLVTDVKGLPPIPQSTHLSSIRHIYHPYCNIYPKAPCQRTLTSPTPHSTTCNPRQSRTPFGSEHSRLDTCHGKQACHHAPHLQKELFCFPHPICKSRSMEWFGMPRDGAARTGVGGWLGGWLGSWLAGWLAGRLNPPPPPWLAQLQRKKVSRWLPSSLEMWQIQRACFEEPKLTDGGPPPRSDIQLPTICHRITGYFFRDSMRLNPAK